MATYTRNNAWNNGGSFSNTDLLWYAKGVRKMMSRGLDDQASWWFFAAIHGEYVNPKTSWYATPPQFPDWGFITSPPAVPTTPLPTAAIQRKFWNQCQHGSWYFLPWHRGYLFALEAQLRKDIVSLGGPATWALPYWNYFGGNGGNQYKLPPALAAKTLPDHTPNPLYVALRYGPDGNSVIYIPTPAGEAAHPGDPNFGYGPVLATALGNDLFTGSDAVTRPPGFGGQKTGFSHGGNVHGNVESNPHDLVHVYVGGSKSNSLYGLMADPGTAALDPIFYLHHANIDRMWAAWNANGHANPTDPSWLKGPTRTFVMPLPEGPWSYTPSQVDNLNKLNYTYQQLDDSAVPPTAALAQRLRRLGATTAADQVDRGFAAHAVAKRAELLGATKQALRIRSAVNHTAVKLDKTVRSRVAASLFSASATNVPDHVYVKLENIRGNFDAAVLSVYVELPEGAKPGKSEKQLAGSVGLFGLRRASVKDGPHAGDGLTFILNITRVVDDLFVNNKLDVNALRVTVVPTRPLPDGVDITVGRISVFRETQ